MIKIVVQTTQSGVSQLAHATQYEPIAVNRMAGTLTFLLSQENSDKFLLDLAQVNAAAYQAHQELADQGTGN